MQTIIITDSLIINPIDSANTLYSYKSIKSSEALNARK